MLLRCSTGNYRVRGWKTAIHRHGDKWGCGQVLSFTSFHFYPVDTRSNSLSLSPSLLSSWFECFHCNPVFALLQELITRITPFNGFSGFIIYTFFPALGWFRNFLGSKRVRLEQYVCSLHSFSWNSRNWTFRLIIKGYFPLLKWKLMYINSRS